MKTAVVFPGQGAQFRGMGKEYFPDNRQLIDVASDVLGYSILNLCLNDPNGSLRQTQFTQPAVFVVNVMIYNRYLEEGGAVPTYLAGHSLGEYNALWAAGAFDFATGLRLVRKRGELMAQAKDGGMAAVIGLTYEKINLLIAEENIDTVQIANTNTSAQIVISGLKDSIIKVREIFIKHGAVQYIPLPVGGAFHSKYMKPAYEEFRLFLQSVKINDLETDVVSNVTGLPYTGSVIDTLALQIISEVKWYQSIMFLLANEVKNIKEVGPGKILSNMVNDIMRSANLKAV